jgi:hypothetical protein
MNEQTILFNYLLAVERSRLDWEYFSQRTKAQRTRDEAPKDKAYVEALGSF